MKEVKMTEEVIVDNLGSINQEEMLNVTIVRKKDISLKTVLLNHRIVADHLGAALSAEKWATYLMNAKGKLMIKKLAVIEEEVEVETVKVMTIVMEQKIVKEIIMDRHTSLEMMEIHHKLRDIEDKELMTKVLEEILTKEGVKIEINITEVVAQGMEVLVKVE